MRLAYPTTVTQAKPIMYSFLAIIFNLPAIQGYSKAIRSSVLRTLTGLLSQFFLMSICFTLFLTLMSSNFSSFSFFANLAFYLFLIKVRLYSELMGRVLNYTKVNVVITLNVNLKISVLIVTRKTRHSTRVLWENKKRNGKMATHPVLTFPTKSIYTCPFSRRGTFVKKDFYSFAVRIP